MNLLKHLSSEGENAPLTHSLTEFQYICTYLDVSRLSATIKYSHGLLDRHKMGISSITSANYSRAENY